MSRKKKESSIFEADAVPVVEEEKKSGRLYSPRPSAETVTVETVTADGAPKKYKKPSNHYVDNVEFYHQIIQFRKDNWDRVTVQHLRPNIPNCIGEKILKICNKLSLRFNFINYRFRQEMIDDALVNCINYIWNFDPEKSKNPFSYFTLITHRAFIRRIQREKKYSANLAKYSETVWVDVGYDALDRKANADEDFSKEISSLMFDDQSISKWHDRARAND